MNQIALNESNANLRAIYFVLTLIDDTPDLDQDGGQPEINLNDTGWTTTGVGVLQSVGFGSYRAILTSVSTLGTILSRYNDTFGEEVQVVQYLEQNLFTTSSSSNSYVQISEAENYFATRLKTDDWDDASPKDRNKALIMATRDIDRLVFSGIKNSILEFPRNDSTTIPEEIKIACCEIALRHLGDVEMEFEFENLTVESQGIASVRDTYARTFVDEARRAGINSSIAWTYIKPFLADLRTFNLCRVS